MRMYRPALESINFNRGHPIGAKLEAIIDKIRSELHENSVTVKTKYLEEIDAVVRKELGLNIKTELRDDVNAGMQVTTLPTISSLPANKHLADMIRYLSTPENIKEFGSAIVGAIHVDLDRPFVSGTLIDANQSRMQIGMGLLKADFTTRELTAGILHELGHLFDVYEKYGEYVWLNYYLQDGIDILLGKKPNKVNIRFATVEELTKACEDPEIRKQLMREPTEPAVRAAVMSTYKKLARCHMSADDDWIDARYNEQGADKFAARLGYGKDIATSMAKLGAMFGSDSPYKPGITSATYGFLFMGSLAGVYFTVAGAAAIAPIAIAGIALGFIFLSSLDVTDTYDALPIRISKMKQNAIREMKYTTNKQLKQQLIKDIAEIDAILKKYYDNPSVFELMATFMFPDTRKSRHLIERENQLNALFDNDLFVISEKFKHA